MKSDQPNFEKVKQAFYDTFVNHEMANFALHTQVIASFPTMPKYWPDRKDEFKKDFNSWLNSLDIRCVGQLIDAIVKENKVYLAEWIKSKEFTIDYNKHEALDLLKKQTELELAY